MTNGFHYTAEGYTMSNEDLKHIIAQLLQDAQRIQQLEPNAGTAARIEEAKAALAS